MTKSLQVDPAQIPEVQAFVEVSQRLEDFKKNNAQFFQWLDALGTEYNEKLDAASAAVRRMGVSSGPFDRYQEAVTYDADALFDLLGREKALDYGGTEEHVVKRDVDKKRVDFNISCGNIPEDVAAQVRKISGRYKSIPKVAVP